MKLCSYRKLLFSVLLSAAVFFLYAQAIDASKNVLPDETSLLLDGSSNLEPSAKNGSADGQGQSVTERRTGLDTTVAGRGGFFQLFFALLIVCLLAYVVLKFLKKSSVFYGTDDPYLKNVASINIAQGKSVHVITLGETAYLVGVTDSSISKIGEVDDKNLIDAMNLAYDKKNASPKKDFASVLGAFIHPQHQPKPEVVNKDFFDSQRERLNNAVKEKP